MKQIRPADLDALAVNASASPRGRTHLTLHADNLDPVQRFFIAADRRTYIRPHRHLTRSELVVVVRGAFELLVFEADGGLLSRSRVAADGDAVAYETPTGLWHTLRVLQDGSALLEVKEGPYDPATAVDFAAWAPAEGDAGVGAFQKWLHDAQPGQRFSG